MTVSRTEWLERLAEMLGVTAPSPEEVEDLLALAAAAAHSSERTAAPISCWLVAKSGVSAAEARLLAEQLAVATGGHRRCWRDRGPTTRSRQ